MDDHLGIAPDAIEEIRSLGYLLTGLSPQDALGLTCSVPGCTGAVCSLFGRNGVSGASSTPIMRDLQLCHGHLKQQVTEVIDKSRWRG